MSNKSIQSGDECEELFEGSKQLDQVVGLDSDRGHYFDMPCDSDQSVWITYTCSQSKRELKVAKK